MSSRQRKMCWDLGLFWIILIIVVALSSTALADTRDNLKGMRCVTYSPTPTDYATRHHEGAVYFDSDFANDDFQALWGKDRTGIGREDVKRIAHELGARYVRLYDWNVPPARNHKPFLEECSKAGIKVIVPISNYFVGLYDQGQSAVADMHIRNIINELVTDGAFHPAVAMISVGNETGLSGKSPGAVVKAIEAAIRAQEELGVSAGDLRPMTVPQDFGAYNGFPAGISRLKDIRDAIAGSAFLAQRNFLGTLYVASMQTSNPGSDVATWLNETFPRYFPDDYVILTELGSDATTQGGNENQAAFNKAAWEAVAGSSNRKALGACMFDFVNQDWKGGPEAHFGMNTKASGSTFAHTKSNQQYPVDVLTPKPYFNTFQGLWKGVGNNLAFWETEVGVVNLGPDRVRGRLLGFDANGVRVWSRAVFLEGHGRLELDVAEAAGSDASRIKTKRLDIFSGQAAGYQRVFQDQKYRFALEALASPSQEHLFVPHIASNSEWRTRFGLLNTTDTPRNVQFLFDDGQEATVSVPGRGHAAFDFASLFNGASQPDIGAARIADASGMIGVMLFEGGQRSMLGGVSLSEAATTALHFPHLAHNQEWWTGLVVYNPGEQTAELALSFSDVQGNEIGTGVAQVGPGERMVGTPETLDFPVGAEWLSVYSSRPVTGFVLFGANAEDQLAGFSVTQAATTRGVFPKLESAGWTGIAFVNPGSSAIQVDLEARNDAGQIVAASSVPLAARQKQVSMVEALFPGQDISTATHVGFTAGSAVVGFQLNGSIDGTMLDGMPGLGTEATAGTRALYFPSIRSSTTGNITVLHDAANIPWKIAHIFYTGHDSSGNKLFASDHFYPSESHLLEGVDTGISRFTIKYYTNNMEKFHKDTHAVSFENLGGSRQGGSLSTDGGMPGNSIVMSGTYHAPDFNPNRLAVVDEHEGNLLIRGNFPFVGSSGDGSNPCHTVSGKEHCLALEELEARMQTLYDPNFDISAYELIDFSLIDNQGTVEELTVEFGVLGLDLNNDVQCGTNWLPYDGCEWDPKKIYTEKSPREFTNPWGVVWWPIYACNNRDRPCNPNDTDIGLNKFRFKEMSGYLKELLQERPPSGKKRLIYIHCVQGTDRTGALHIAYLLDNNPEMTFAEAVRRATIGTKQGSDDQQLNPKLVPMCSYVGQAYRYCQEKYKDENKPAGFCELPGGFGRDATMCRGS